MTDRSVSFSVESGTEDMFFREVYGEELSRHFSTLPVSTREKLWRDNLEMLPWKEREVIRMTFGLGCGQMFSHTENDYHRIFRTSRTGVQEIQSRALKKLKSKVKIWGDGDIPQAV